MNIKKNILFSKKEMLLFCIQRFMFGFSYSLMIPIIPLYFNYIGISTLVIGVIMSAYGVAKAIMQIIFGVVINKIGDKRLLIVSFLLMSIIPILYTLNSSSILASIIYIAQGAILGISAPATFALLSRSLEESKRGECTGYASAVFTLSGSIAAIIGGYIATKLNNYNLVFYLSTAFTILTVAFIIFKIKKDTHSEIKEVCSLKSKIKEIVSTVRKEKLLPKIVLLGIIALLGDFIYGCIISIFPFYGQEVLGASAFYTSIIISIYLFIFGIFAPLGGWTSDKIGVRKQLFISFIFMIISLASLAFVKGIIIFTIAIIVYFLGATFLNAGLQNSLLKVGKDKKIAGAVFGIVGACESLGYATGPGISAGVYNLNKIWFFPVLLIFTIVVFIIFITLNKKAL